MHAVRWWKCELCVLMVTQTQEYVFELSIPVTSSVSFQIFAALAKSELVYFINPSDKQKLLCHKVNFKETGTRLIEQEASFT